MYIVRCSMRVTTKTHHRSGSGRKLEKRWHRKLFLAVGCFIKWSRQPVDVSHLHNLRYLLLLLPAPLCSTTRAYSSPITPSFSPSSSSSQSCPIPLCNPRIRPNVPPLQLYTSSSRGFPDASSPWPVFAHPPPALKPSREVRLFPTSNPLGKQCGGSATFVILVQTFSPKNSAKVGAMFSWESTSACECIIGVLPSIELSEKVSGSVWWHPRQTLREGATPPAVAAGAIHAICTGGTKGEMRKVSAIELGERAAEERSDMPGTIVRRI